MTQVQTWIAEKLPEMIDGIIPLPGGRSITITYFARCERTVAMTQVQTWIAEKLPEMIDGIIPLVKPEPGGRWYLFIQIGENLPMAFGPYLKSESASDAQKSFLNKAGLNS